MRRPLLALAAVVAACAAVPAVAQAVPTIDVECNRSPVCEGPWFAGPVFIDWTVAGATQINGCKDMTVRQDTTGAIHDCVATGNGTATATITVKVDVTPPAVTDVVPDRPPDHAGWYSRPVSFSPLGKDAASGIDHCDRVTYGGPDSAAATIVATCRDVAGHVGSRAFPLRYDATPPDPSAATVKTGDRVVKLRWPAAASASVIRTPGIGGEPSSALVPAADGITDLRVRNDVDYRYVVTLADAAGNAASRELVAVPGPRLLAPAKRALVAAPPVLRWTPVRGARYYNVQLFRDGRQVLSAWPKRPELRLRRRWRFGGRHHRLRGGRYTWYVWPGEGPRSARRYGERIGARSFVFDRRGSAGVRQQ
jgi:hypothetical protein